MKGIYYYETYEITTLKLAYSVPSMKATVCCSGGSVRENMTVLGAGFSPRGPGSSRGHVMWDCFVDKLALGQVSFKYLVSLANSNSTKCSILVYHRDRYLPTYQLDSVSPHSTKLEKKKKENLRPTHINTQPLHGELKFLQMNSGARLLTVKLVQTPGL
jgi:hypothetical protein